MSETFEQVWRRAKLEMPAVPPLLVRGWAQEAYTKLCDSWGWSFLRTESALVVNAARTVTVTFTQGSATITSAGLFLAADAGRQIRVTRIPIYTIASVTNANTAIIDRAYTEDNSTSAATIQDCYTTMPADFRRFLVVYDRYFQRIIPFWFSEDQLAVADPGRLISDQGPRYLVARKYSTATATLGQVQYEYWPAPISFRTYPYLYIRRAEQLTDADVLPGVLSERADLLKTYCLSRGAMWPGTTDAKNPFFSPPTAQMLRMEWDGELQRLQNVDDSEYPQQLMQIDWARRLGAVTGTAAILRQTDATVDDYY